MLQETSFSTVKWVEDVSYVVYSDNVSRMTEHVRAGTTTGMVTACLIATTVNWDMRDDEVPSPEESDGVEIYDSMDGPSEEEAYLQGMLRKLHASSRG